MTQDAAGSAHPSDDLPVTMSLSLAMLLGGLTGEQADVSSQTIGIALGLPEPHFSVLTDWRRSFGDLAADSIPPHITLLPPTVIASAALEAIETHLAEVAQRWQPFVVELNGTESFRPVSAVVFLALSRGAQECDQLQRAIRQGPLVRELSFPYHPHVTVAHDLESEALDRAQKTLAEYRCDFPVEGFTLYDQDSDGTWVPRRTFTFG